MRLLSFRYTVGVLSDLGEGEKVADHVILGWVNTTLSEKRKDTQITSFKVCVCVCVVAIFELTQGCIYI